MSFLLSFVPFEQTKPAGCINATGHFIGIPAAKSEQEIVRITGIHPEKIGAPREGGSKEMLLIFAGRQPRAVGKGKLGREEEKNRRGKETHRIWETDHPNSQGLTPT